MVVLTLVAVIQAQVMTQVVQIQVMLTQVIQVLILALTQVHQV